jgi:hypothetical protein
MDYSSTVHDADNLTGASPWGSSPTPSPQHSRTNFGPSGTDGPPSPTPYRENRPVSNGSYTSESSGGFNRPENSSLDSGTDNVRDVPPPSMGGLAPAQGEQPDLGSQQQQQRYQQQQGSQADFPQEQVRQERATAARRGPGPQYKLQAKITGLERTGRKDPILRFDVHVRLQQHPACGKIIKICINTYRLIYLHFERRNSVMSAELIRSL